MNTTRSNIYISLMLFLSLAWMKCTSYKSCQDFPRSFHSMDEEEIRLNTQVCEAHFDSLSLPNGLEVHKALYYTCDRYLGYLIIHTVDKKLLYRNIPYQYWKNMIRSTKQFEMYYVQNVKYKFPVYLESPLR